jgi:hypothetical protein
MRDVEDRAMKLLAVVGALAILALPSLAGGQQQRQPATPAQKAPAQKSAAEAKKEPEKLVCATEKPIGSNLAVRVCKSQAQLDRERLDAQAFMDLNKAVKDQPPVFGTPR